MEWFSDSYREEKKDLWYKECKDRAGASKPSLRRDREQQNPSETHLKREQRLVQPEITIL